MKLRIWCTSNYSLTNNIHLARRMNEKLAPRFCGPFLVLKRIGKVACQLALPPQRKHLVFHVCQLKKAVGQALVSPILPPQLTVDLVLSPTPASIMGIRLNATAPSTLAEVLVQWHDMSTEEATWEDVQFFHDHFHLEDKVLNWAGGISKSAHAPPIIHTYSRRPKVKSKKVSNDEVPHGST